MFFSRFCGDVSGMMKDDNNEAGIFLDEMSGDILCVLEFGEKFAVEDAPGRDFGCCPGCCCCTGVDILLNLVIWVNSSVNESSNTSLLGLSGTISVDSSISKSISWSGRESSLSANDGKGISVAAMLVVLLAEIVVVLSAETGAVLLVEAMVVVVETVVVLVVEVLLELGISLFLSIASGSNGYTPHFRNPFLIVATESAFVSLFKKGSKAFFLRSLLDFLLS